MNESRKIGNNPKKKTKRKIRLRRRKKAAYCTCAKNINYHDSYSVRRVYVFSLRRGRVFVCNWTNERIDVDIPLCIVTYVNLLVPAVHTKDCKCIFLLSFFLSFFVSLSVLANERMKWTSRLVRSIVVFDSDRPVSFSCSVSYSLLTCSSHCPYFFLVLPLFSFNFTFLFFFFSSSSFYFFLALLVVSYLSHFYYIYRLCFHVINQWTLRLIRPAVLPVLATCLPFTRSISFPSPFPHAFHVVFFCFHSSYSSLCRITDEDSSVSSVADWDVRPIVTSRRSGTPAARREADRGTLLRVVAQLGWFLLFLGCEHLGG